MCWDQVEKEKKKLRKRAGERKREREVLESSGKQRKIQGEDGDIWVYVCGGEKSRGKKRKKKKKHMDDRKKEKKRKLIYKKNDNLENSATIFSQ